MLTRKLVIRPEAEAEIVEAHNWYKLQAEGLSSEFLRAVDACLNSIEREPLAYSIVYKQVFISKFGVRYCESSPMASSSFMSR